MVWQPFVLTTDRSMILATRYRSEGLDDQGPITEALQLRSRFDVSLPSRGLMGSSPERPGDDVGWMDLSLGEPDGDAADLLNRPADQGRRRAAGSLGAVFGGLAVFAR